MAEVRWLKRASFHFTDEGVRSSHQHHRILQFKDSEGAWLDVPTVEEFVYRGVDNQHGKFIGTPGEWKKFKKANPGAFRGRRVNIDNTVTQ